VNFLSNIIHDINTNEHTIMMANEASIDSDASSKAIVNINDLSTSLLVDVCGILLSKRLGHQDTRASTEATPQQAQSSDTSSLKKMRPNTITTTLVETTTSQRNLQSLALALCQNNPILLEGVTGAGKTTLIDHLARITGNDDIIKVIAKMITFNIKSNSSRHQIHLSDQADAKVLLGTYICTDTPGEFKWQPGALVQAVSEGRWIVIEDIDLAPLDVISLLLPLLETSKLFIPGRGTQYHIILSFDSSFELKDRTR